MLEKPDVQDARIKDCLTSQYGLAIKSLEFLPIGADVNTAVYKAVTEQGLSLYVKLRSGDFFEASVAIPAVLHDNGVKQVIVPIPIRDQQFSTRLDSFHLTLYPFIDGRTGSQVALSDSQWLELGIALKGIHNTKIPEKLREVIPQETYSPKWREEARSFLARIQKDNFTESTAVELANLIKSKQAVIEMLIERAEELGAALRDQNLEFVLCHADLHGNNILIDARGAVYIVDWDTLVFAPKERDLMFIGGGIGGTWNKPEEERLFYRGYGPTDINPLALVYYRCERIVEDIAAFCEQIFLTDEGGRDRARVLTKLGNAFLPNNVVEIAMR